jgi:phosphotransacetylase
LKTLGTRKPRVCALSGDRGYSASLQSAIDAEALWEASISGTLGNCEILKETNLSKIFLGNKRRLEKMESIDIRKLPDILLVPGLDAGNILCKLDFLLNVTRRSLVLTSRGPVIVPSRADTRDAIVGEMAMGVVVSDRMKMVAANEK